MHRLSLTHSGLSNDNMGKHTGYQEKATIYFKKKIETTLLELFFSIHTYLL